MEQVSQEVRAYLEAMRAQPTPRASREVAQRSTSTGSPVYCEPYCGPDDEPPTILGWFEWVRAKAVTHTQHRCPGCGYYTIWRPK